MLETRKREADSTTDVTQSEMTKTFQLQNNSSKGDPEKTTFTKATERAETLSKQQNTAQSQVISQQKSGAYSEVLTSDINPSKTKDKSNEIVSTVTKEDSKQSSKGDIPAQNKTLRNKPEEKAIAQSAIIPKEIQSREDQTKMLAKSAVESTNLKSWTEKDQQKAKIDEEMVQTMPQRTASEQNLKAPIYQSSFLYRQAQSKAAKQKDQSFEKLDSAAETTQSKHLTPAADALKDGTPAITQGQDSPKDSESVSILKQGISLEKSQTHITKQQEMHESEPISVKASPNHIIAEDDVATNFKSVQEKEFNSKSDSVFGSLSITPYESTRFETTKSTSTEFETLRPVRKSNYLKASVPQEAEKIQEPESESRATQRSENEHHNELAPEEKATIIEKINKTQSNDLPELQKGDSNTETEQNETEQSRKSEHKVEVPVDESKAKNLTTKSVDAKKKKKKRTSSEPNTRIAKEQPQTQETSTVQGIQSNNEEQMKSQTNIQIEKQHQQTTERSNMLSSRKADTLNSLIQTLEEGVQKISKVKLQQPLAQNKQNLQKIDVEYDEGSSQQKLEEEGEIVMGKPTISKSQKKIDVVKIQNTSSNELPKPKLISVYQTVDGSKPRKSVDETSYKSIPIKQDVVFFKPETIDLKKQATQESSDTQAPQVKIQKSRKASAEKTASMKAQDQLELASQKSPEAGKQKIGNIETPKQTEESGKSVTPHNRQQSCDSRIALKDQVVLDSINQHLAMLKAFQSPVAKNAPTKADLKLQQTSNPTIKPRKSSEVTPMRNTVDIGQQHLTSPKEESSRKR